MGGPLVLVGFAAFFCVALVVGVRLLALWRRTGELPELLMGIGVLGIGPIGFGALVVGTAVAKQHGGAANVAFVASTVAVSAGVLAKCIFNWHVYHPQSRVAQVLVVLVALLLLGLALVRSIWTGFAPDDPRDPALLLQSGLLIGALLWGSFESLYYWAMLKRRARLGLADAVVANRFFLWGLGAGSAGLGSAVGTVAALVSGVPNIEIPWVVASSSAHGFVAAVAISLAFVPPSAYMRWVAREAQAS